MKRYFPMALATVFAFALAACGGGDSSSDGAAEPGATTGGGEAPPAGGGELTTPDWYSFDAAANKVTMTVTAGTTNVNNFWNFAGGINGNMDITVPVGAAVEINFVNNDQLMAHSIGISALAGNRVEAMFTDPQPAFAGAMSSNPTEQLSSTMPGESETITFTADAAGDYTMVCYVPGHALTGMWVKFTVSASGEAGVRGAM